MNLLKSEILKTLATQERKKVQIIHPSHRICVTLDLLDNVQVTEVFSMLFLFPIKIFLDSQNGPERPPEPSFRGRQWWCLLLVRLCPYLDS